MGAVERAEEIQLQQQLRAAHELRLQYQTLHRRQRQRLRRLARRQRRCRLARENGHQRTRNVGVLRDSEKERSRNGRRSPPSPRGGACTIAPALPSLEERTPRPKTPPSIPCRGHRRERPERTGDISMSSNANEFTPPSLQEMGRPCYSSHCRTESRARSVDGLPCVRVFALQWYLSQLHIQIANRTGFLMNHVIYVLRKRNNLRN